MKTPEIVRLRAFFVCHLISPCGLNLLRVVEVGHPFLDGVYHELLHTLFKGGVLNGKAVGHNLFGIIVGIYLLKG